MRQEKYTYSQSVFVPETGFSNNLLSNSELEQIFKITKRKDPNICLMDYLICSLLDKSLGGYKSIADQLVQTEEYEDNLTLDQKLKRIDAEYLSAQITERQLPCRE